MILKQFALPVALTMFLAATASGQTFVFDLTGAQEVPPVSTTATGGCAGVLDQAAATFSITCVHNVVNATLMHIHRGVAGTNGPVAFDIGNPSSGVVTATWSGMTAADITQLLEGELYVNIHTAGRPAGEIRGQIVERAVDTVAFNASGAQVVPPGESLSSANCTANLNDAATALDLQCTHDMAAANAAHVHRAPAGANGPIVFTFSNPASPLAGSMPMTQRLLADFAARFLYLDIHAGTSEENADEIRGQIGAAPAPVTTGTIRITKSTVPAGGTGFGFTTNIPGGPAAFTLDDDATQTFTSVAAGTYTVTESLPGNYSVTDLVCSDSDSSGNAFSRTATVRLQAGETVTCTFRNLQNVAAPTTFVFHLSGDQEVPPTNSTARGGCFGQFDPATAALTMICTHNVAAPTQVHVHRGARGQNGPVVFDLGDPLSPIEARWNMTPAEVADLFAGNFYVNLHASGRPAGEIRGQIVPRSVDSFAFPLGGAQEVPPTDSTNSGNCMADLADNATSVAVQCLHTVPTVTAAHLHAAPPGIDGPAFFDFPNTRRFASDVRLTPRLVADFAAGFLYVNIHSPAYETGEIRGNLIGAASHGGATDIPTTSEWGLILMALALAALSFKRMV